LVSLSIFGSPIVRLYFGINKQLLYDNTGVCCIASCWHAISIAVVTLYLYFILSPLCSRYTCTILHVVFCCVKLCWSCNT
jgi:hypothetical protein